MGQLIIRVLEHSRAAVKVLMAVTRGVKLLHIKTLCMHTQPYTGLPLLEYSITSLCAYRLVLRGRVQEPSSLLTVLGIRCKTEIAVPVAHDYKQK